MQIPPGLPAAQSVELASLIEITAGGIASRVLAKSNGGSVTLFAFDAGQGLSTHTTPFDALVVTLEGALTLTVDGHPVNALPASIVRLPANIPHAVDATVASRMLLIMLRGPD